MLLIRKIGAVVLLVAAVWVWFNLAPAAEPDHSSVRLSINAADDRNNAGAQGAPQQAVVNGWTNLAYQELISEQLDTNASYSHRDDRAPAMLGLCVAGIALLALTSSGRGEQTARPIASTAHGDSPDASTLVTSSASPSPGPGSVIAPSEAHADVNTTLPATPRKPSKKMWVWIATGAVTMAAAAGFLITRGEVSEPVRTVCDQLKSGDIVGAEASITAGDPDLADQFDTIGFLAVDQERRQSDLKTLVPPTVTGKDDFVQSQIDNLDEAWTTCSDADRDFPRVGSSQYQGVHDQVVSDAGNRWDLDGPG